jgi:putative transposase
MMEERTKRNIMSAQHFSTGARFHWRGSVYEVRRTLPSVDAPGSQSPNDNAAGGRVIIEDVATEAALTLSVDTLKQALFEGELQFETISRQDKGARQEARGPGDAITGSNSLPLGDYPPQLADIARYRLEVIQPLVSLPASERTLAAVQARVREINSQNDSESRVSVSQETGDKAGGSMATSISVASVYRWMKHYTDAGNDIRALVPNTEARGGKMESRLQVQVDNTIEAVIREKYMARERVTAEAVLYEVAVRIEEANRSRVAHDKFHLPSRRTVARRIDAFTLTQGLAFYAAKHGKAAAKRAYAQYGMSTKPTMPLERVEIDHTRSDLIVVDDFDNLPLGRLTFTSVFDVYSAYPLGLYLGFELPSYYTVMEALYHAICPKRGIREKYGTEHTWLAYGVPHVLVVDNGKEFVGRDLQDACQSLGIVLQQTPVRTPTFKGTIERQFGSLNTMLFHTLPGTTFSNISKRGDYNSVKQACISLSDMEKIIHIFIVDLYAERYHRGLHGIPARKWEEAIRYGFIPRVPASLQELQVLLGRVEYRTIHHYGIDLDLIRYNCAELGRLRALRDGEAVKLKYHPGDLSRIWVYDAFDRRYIEVPALDQEYTDNLSLWKHRVIKRVAKKEEDQADLAALGRAKRRIQKVVDEARGRTAAARRGTQARTARWDTAGKPIQALGSASSINDISRTFGGAQAEDDQVLEALEVIRGREVDLGMEALANSIAEDSTAPSLGPVSSDTAELGSYDGILPVDAEEDGEEEYGAAGWEIDYGGLPGTRRNVENS